MDERILIKWKVLIDACKSYYIDCQPTGMSDSEFDKLEVQAAQEDNFFVRDYVFNIYSKGAKSKNSYIDRIKKIKVEDTSMLQAIKNLEIAKGEGVYATLKFDGASLAIYLDPTTGNPLKVVTVGNLNLDNYGVDQTWKLLHFLPKKFPKGIVAIQAEALIDTIRLTESDPEKARQKANGLINSKYAESEVSNLLTIRAYRYYTSSCSAGKHVEQQDYRNILNSFETTRSPIDGHILFAPADIWTIDELEKNVPPLYTESDMTLTSTGTFLNDGWVVYDKYGKCINALKFSKAGILTEIPKTTVIGIQWNSQVKKGKDSWSANVLINPVTIRGCTVKKPSAGSVKKLITHKITPGAEVGIILANSTIPMVGEVFKEGSGNFMWPKCSCGYQLSESDIYGSLLKCGSQRCTERYERMYLYLSSLKNIVSDLDLNKLLVLDRFKWEKTGINISTLLEYVEKEQTIEFYNYLGSFLTTDLQKRNLNLVAPAAYASLLQTYIELSQNG